MTSVTLAACLTLIAYLAGVTAASAVAVGLLRSALEPTDPARRARGLFLVRLLPASFGLFVALGLVLPSFLWLEPARTGERAGSGLVTFAAASGLVLLAGLARGAAGLFATRRLVRRWARRARPIALAGIALPAFAVDERFPLVAIAGWLRPRLYVSEKVLRHCTEAELAAIVSHEAGHLHRGDTWKRLLLRACPDLFALLPLGAEIEGLWADAAEQAADDHAAALSEARSLDLASALIRVARLAGPAHPGALPLTTLYRGGGVRRRVSRLLSPRAAGPAGEAPRPLGAVGALLLAAGVLGPAAAVLGLLHPVHRLLETVVRVLG